MPTYDWMNFLAQYFKKLPNLKRYHHFRFDRDNLGTVFCKEHWNSEEKAVMLLRDAENLPQPAILPPVISAKGMSCERSHYLFKEIREFCHPGTEDLVAPQN